MRYILCAAIWYHKKEYYPNQPRNIEKGFVIAGRRHHNCITTAWIFGSNTLTSNHTQGFITNDDLFVGRSDAAEIAFDAKQIQRKQTRLYSEDLY